MRALLLPLAAILALATGLGLLGVAATVTRAPPVVVATGTSEPAAVTTTPTEKEFPEIDALAADIPVELPDGPRFLRVTRLALAPGAVLPPVTVSESAALVVEVGTVGVQVTDGWEWPGPERPWVKVGPDDTRAETVLLPGDHLTLRPGTVRVVRNAGPAPAAVLVMSIEPYEPCGPPITGCIGQTHARKE